MEKEADVCCFDWVSDDVLLHILLLVPRTHWCNMRRVNQRFRNVCTDKEMFRYSNFNSAYGLKESDLQEYLRTGSKFIQKLNLNHCYWLTSSTLSTFISRCKNIQHLYLLDCKLTTKGLSKILCSIECLKTLVLTVRNLLEFSNEINSNQEVQNSLVNLQHFGLNIKESMPDSPISLQFHLSQQTTIIEYCPNLESFCVIGQPGSCLRMSKRLIHPLLVKKQNMANLKSMSINNTNDPTSRLYFFGILVKAFEAGVHFRNLSVSGLDLKQAVKKSYFIRALRESCPSLVTLDLSKVLIDELESSICIDGVQCLRYLNLSHVRSESSSVGLMTIASKCPNLVSLNLHGATSGHRYWGEVELQMLDQVLKECSSLQHLNLSGIHVHVTQQSKSLISVLTRNNVKGLKSLAITVCSLVNPDDQTKTKQHNYVSKVTGKRLRISRQPVASTSSAPDRVDTYSELQHLAEVCPNLTSLEVINSNFNHSVVTGGNKSPYDPCVHSYKVLEDLLKALSNFTSLQYLQITGVPCITDGRVLREIATHCVHLKRLSLAYIGLGTPIPLLWDSLQYFKGLLDLRIEQPGLKLDSRLYEACLKCKTLQRLTIVSKNSKITEPKVLENCIQQTKSLYLIQLFTDSTLKECEKLQSTLQKRFEVERPGFLATVEQLLHDRMLNVVDSLPLKHLEEMTLLTSRVASTPRHFVWGE